MKTPNKVKNGIVALIKSACERLNITPQEMIRLHQRVKELDNPAQYFATYCVELEGDPDSALRTYLQNPNIEFIAVREPIIDTAYTLLYSMIEEFYVQQVSTFFDRNMPRMANDHSLLSTNILCPVCKNVMFDTPSGMTCLQGHGGTDLDAEIPIDAKVLDQERQNEAFGSEAPTQIHDPLDRPDIPWNDDQNRAFKEIFNWYKTKDRKPIFRMFGFAGSGKTSMAREIAWVIENGEDVPRGNVMFASFTGKAASVMQSKGCNGASTIHSLIYRPRIDQDTGQVIGFTRFEESPLRFCNLLIIDEVSMVNEEMALDLMSFGVSILVIGDPDQLKPVRGEGYFTQARADVMLTVIERQAKDDPIIYLATRARLGEPLKPGRYGESRVYASTSQLTDKAVKNADHILVGMNKTREAMNRRVRMLSGRYDIDTQFPVKGDRLMCLKNNKNNGLLNGTIWQCTQPIIQPIMKLSNFRDPNSEMENTNILGLHFKVRSFDLFDSSGAPLIVNTVCSVHHFDSTLPKPPWKEIAGTDEWTFGDASTIHKAQGSQWDDVVLIDESSVFSDQIKQHRYTGITRAAKSIRIYLT